MSPYALNVKKGTKITNGDIGELPGGMAVPITDKQALIAKHLLGVIVFDKVAGISEDKSFKGMYGESKAIMEARTEELRTYESFVREFKDVKIAGEKWNEYKKLRGMK